VSAQRQAISDLATTDTLLDDLEARVAALEAVVAVAWPWRIVAAWRLGRALRCSVGPFPGETFAQRRIEATTNAWLYRLQQEREGR
jgi:hypothetical protein